MAQNGSLAATRYCCRSCGALMEVRVGFRGRLVWKVGLEDANFGDTEPELRGDCQDPQLVCSADVMHTTGFKLNDGVVAADPKFVG